jgi:hypothetical protein
LFDASVSAAKNFFACAFLSRVEMLFSFCAMVFSVIKKMRQKNIWLSYKIERIYFLLPAADHYSASLRRTLELSAKHLQAPIRL